MKEKIEQRLAGYKEEKEAWVTKQKQYRWTTKEKEEGSTAYGYYQEQEVMYNNKIVELEWVLELFVYSFSAKSEQPRFNAPNKDGVYKRNDSFDM